MDNVVLVTVDSLRADHVGSFGYERDTSPAIDELAASGLEFDAFANSHWTRASFPSIVTSTYPLAYGGFEYLSGERTTVGEAVTDTHDTAAFHSNLWLSRDYNYDRGFDHFYDSKTEPSLFARLRTYLKLNLDHDGVVYRTLQWLYDTTEEKAGVDVGQTYKDAETITDHAIDWIDGAEEPFVCWVHYMDVHHPYVPHDNAAAALDLDLDLSEREAIQLRRKMVEEPEYLTDEEHDTLVDLYDNEIRYTDAQIGRLLDAVDEHADRDRTSVVVTSDHGEEFAEHGGYSHNSSLYDEVLHVPLVVDPANDVTESGRQNEILELLDVAPTVCDLAGVASVPSYEGRSAVDAAGSGEDARVIIETDEGKEYKLSLRTREWKYIWNRNTGETELYDLAADPGETENVVDGRNDVAADLRMELEDHLAELRKTNESLPDVAMDAETKARLKNLGYLE